MADVFLKTLLHGGSNFRHLLHAMNLLEWSTTVRMHFGGEQMMVVHRLPGGTRVIDALEPSDNDISWNGRLYGSGTMSMALTLDGMRRAGTQLPLIEPD